MSEEIPRPTAAAPTTDAAPTTLLQPGPTTTRPPLVGESYLLLGNPDEGLPANSLSLFITDRSVFVSGACTGFVVSYRWLDENRYELFDVGQNDGPPCTGGQVEPVDMQRIGALLGSNPQMTLTATELVISNNRSRLEFAAAAN